MTDILVTGASGFIGKVLCRALRDHGHKLTELSVCDGDIADAETLATVAPARHVFHLAGRTFVPDSWKDPQAFHRTNTLGTGNVLEYCHRNGSRLTFVSAFVYGAQYACPISEQCRPRPNNPYALSKYLAEQLCEFYSEYRGLDIAVVRPFNIFGPGQKEPFLIPQIMKQLSAGQSIQVNDLAPRRDYLYIDDLVDALLATLMAPGGYHLLNLGSGISFSVSEMIDIIQSVAGTQLPVFSAEAVRPYEIDDVRADIGMAEQTLDWRPKLTFQQGIERLMQEIEDK